MSTHYVSLLLGLTATATATVVTSFTPLSARAASMTCETGHLFDFDSIQFIQTRPLSSNNCLRFFGERIGAEDPNPQGFVGYGMGHIEISLNSPGFAAPYYAAGMDFSPENLPGAKRSSTLTNDITGFVNFANFLTTNSIAPERIGFSFGPKDGDFTKALNLGTDTNGKEYFASPTSSLEERIYTANPDEVESFLLFDEIKFITFGYSNIYTFLEYGATPAPDDDSEAILSDPFTATKVGGLTGLASGLADAFLADLGRKKIQLVSEDAGVVPDFVFFDPSLEALNPVVSIRFPMQLRIVSAASVPEPSITFGLLSLGLIAVGSRFKPKNRSHD